jgi:tetratricopeptide (TPR) repeat protein
MLAWLTMLSGCKNTHQSNALIPELPDTAFPAYIDQEIEPAADIFAIDQSMIAFIEQHTKKGGTEKSKLSALIHAIFEKKALSYDAQANTSARDTFSQGEANCLSLTIMTYAMTQHLGMSSAFQEVLIPEYWTRRQGNTVINRHINLLVEPRKTYRNSLTKTTITIDFDPQQGMEKFHTQERSKSQIVSNFYVNKAADYIISNIPNSAYAYLRAAINENPYNEGAWLNLGVLFSQHQLFDYAEVFYEMALTVSPEFTSSYDNLALLYKRQGKEQKAKVLQSRLHKKRLTNPYYHMVQGDIALEGNDYKLAIANYKKAISLNHRAHEFYFSLAKAYFQSGDVENATHSLRSAMRRARDKDLKLRYASKMSALVASRQN